MLYAIAILFVCLSIFCYYINKDIFHPACIVTLLWGTLLFLYGYLDHPLWHLSDKFYYSIILWIVPFYIFSNLIGKYKIKNSKYFNNTEFIGNAKSYNDLMPIALGIGIVSCVLLIVYCGGNLVNLRFLLVSSQFPTYINLIFYLSTFLIAYLLVGLINYSKINKRNILTLFLIIIIISVLKSNKTSVLSLFVSVAYILHVRGKLRLSTIFYSIFVLSIFLILITINRADWDFNNDSGLANYLYIYLLSPLTAFDLLLNKGISLGNTTVGESIFIFFYKIFNTFGANLEFSTLGEWVNVPLPTNVFTSMRGFYLDGGYCGIAFGSFIMGIIWGLMYRSQKMGNPVLIVFYATMIPSLFFQSFGDYFFYSFSMTLQYYIFCIILIRGFKYRKFRIRLKS